MAFAQVEFQTIKTFDGAAYFPKFFVKGCEITGESFAFQEESRAC